MPHPANPRIFVLGNAGIDVSLSLPRLPVAGETLVAGAARHAPGGKGLNQAVVAARAGATILFAAPLGCDPDAAVIEAALAAEPFAELRLWRGAGETDRSILMVAADGENCIVTAGARADALTGEAACGFVAQMRANDLLLLQGNLSAATTLTAAQAAIAHGARVMLNAAPLRWPVDDLLPLCDWVVVNEVEAFGITGEAGEAAVRRLRAAGPRVAVVTLGGAGCLVADGAGVSLMAAERVLAVDSTGAGDTFCGVLAACLVGGRAPPEAVRLAQQAASLAVTRPGAFAALPSRAELAVLFAPAA